MLVDWEQQSAGRSEMIMRSLQNVVSSHLADEQLFDFKGLESGAGDSIESEPDSPD